MFSRLFGKPSKSAPAPSTGGRLVYAVGDIHGRLDVLLPLAADILKDIEAAPPAEGAERPLLVFLGDYVDRGPASAGVLDLILELSNNPALEVCALKGNHEEAMLTFLADATFGPTWISHGGGPTIASYGVAVPITRNEPQAWVDAREALLDAVPATHFEFLNGLALLRTEGDYAFVHAGVKPGAPLSQQLERDLLWIRYEFLDAPGPFEKVIVHGHTPTEEPQVTRHRLGVDTGAYATGVLTAVRLQGESRSFLQARARRPEAA